MIIIIICFHDVFPTIKISSFDTLTEPTISATCETVVPDAAPRYNTLDLGAI